MFKQLAYSIFYGNYFYGFCAVALAIESNLQQGLPLNSFWLYVVIYCSTVIFYLFAYIEEGKAKHANKRSMWYFTNRKFVRLSLWLLIFIGSATSFFLFIKYFHHFFRITFLQLLPLAAIALLALSYYGISIGSFVKLNARKTGWFKPFAIGLVWATMATYLPALWSQVEQNVHYSFNHIILWFFFKNFMFVSVLAILFDVKDYAADHNRRLQTFVVRAGLRRTIFLIIIPLSTLGFLSFILFASLMHFPLLRIIINAIPFLLLIIVTWSMQQRKPIIYYLAVIDGLMLVKALCGITAALLIK